MRTVSCFVITPSGKNPAMELIEDEKDGLCRRPSGCADTATKVTIKFQEIYDVIIRKAIKQVNDELAKRGLEIEIECTRGEDLPQGGNIVSQFLQQVCRAEITITDVTGLNPNVLLEYGIRLSVRDSMNLLLCHSGISLPLDIKDQRCIEYTLDLGGPDKARDDIANAIEYGLLQETPESGENLFRRTVEVATGRHLEKRLTEAFKSSEQLVTDLLNEAQRLGGVNPKLRDQSWNFLENLAKTLEADPLGHERAIGVYKRLTELKGFREKRRDVFYKLHEICAADSNREQEAQNYLNEAKALENPSTVL